MGRILGGYEAPLHRPVPIEMSPPSCQTGLVGFKRAVIFVFMSSPQTGIAEVELADQYA